MTSSVLTRILSIMAMVGLLFAPLATPMVAAVSAVAATSSAVAGDPAMAEMPGMASTFERPDCCSPPKGPVRNCGGGCPWVALCTALCLPSTHAAGVAIGPLVGAQVARHSLDDRNRDRMRDPPPRRPPRA